ncbi:protein kinase [Patulibacter brassicae]|uniref:non-specific serine/threonine protein kinase n=1 Tax=Patulibacter brassicae TaxID=1705717 RepID=A0ABU4VKS0_9ACTN|nr:protein kinase [Patulibacter brassicae]MDX8152425.1 protein kinase [Patulibacter brassicae]
MPDVPDQIAAYRILRPLGSGGMGTVHLAEHVTLGRRVALKLLAPELAHDDGFRERFMREARLAARLDHPAVVPVYDAGSDEAGLWLAMRYVPGEDLAARLRRRGPLPPVAAVAVVEALAAALDHAHAQGIVHRDVKPSNVLLEGPLGDDPGALPERVLLADFGLTAELDGSGELTRTGTLLGSIDYVAPEQVDGGDVDARADVYGLTATLVAALTGAPPYDGTTARKLYAHVNAPPPALGEERPALGPFDEVVAAGMAKDAAARPATAGALAADARMALRRIAEPQATQPMAAVDPDGAPARPVPPPGAEPAARPRDAEPTRVVPGTEPTVARPRDADPTRVVPAEPTRVAPGPGRAAPAGDPVGPAARHEVARIAVERGTDPTRVRAGRDGAGPAPPASGAAAAGGRRAAPWAIAGLVALLVALGAVVALGLSRGDDGSDVASTRSTSSAAQDEGRTTGEGGPATDGDGTSSGDAAGADEGTTTDGGDAGSPPPAGGTPVEGGGVLRAGSGAPIAGAPPAEYLAADQGWRTALPAPAEGGWAPPSRTARSGGALHRVRQSGPGGRVVIVDHTPGQAASFASRRDDERRAVPGTAAGTATGYGFSDRRISGIPECGAGYCVDVPLNLGPDGPGWGVLAAAPTADEAWATAIRIAQATGRTGG